MIDDLPGDIPPAEKAATRTRAPREAKKAAAATPDPIPTADAAAAKPDRAKARKKKKAVKAKKRKQDLRHEARAVEEQIGHVFADAALLTTALTHVSALKNPADRWGSY